MVSILSSPGFQKRAMPLSVKAWHQMIASGLVLECGSLPGVSVNITDLFTGIIAA
ncbi:MAG: hypothetical protein JNG86_11360 [Verrucomicrobiaceae bacterium]|nr:hypothetical protein [Verrucomicrobiaceae bacterium]